LGKESSSSEGCEGFIHGDRRLCSRYEHPLQFNEPGGNNKNLKLIHSLMNLELYPPYLYERR